MLLRSFLHRQLIGLLNRSAQSSTQVKSLAESTGDVGSATPSLAVQMVGLNSVPTAGDEFYVCEDEAMARKAADIAEDAQVRATGSGF